ncbi:bifunctional metallophosphatase/5'-nucleotidase [Fructobacillus sp. M1-13]|uniref:Bifunctional metallophosphatase/5'-nucleotidase n=1 Tax=Fructobacillus papyriferae TaxID=2713171 RepID=A0ABS5QQK0_9LACO|nr:bifunctional UDP-sugar hydrolase/5'-nucleotidase [Fructobacillus papyriferae]MBS9334775.1 bifunctional metallophosphatase/5'-nucleotidase [Fructobacillus papyriferae]MCD2158765.1 bifunctional metallophosphatase/5'-nucleotidase [Fructobacillus papyriferae]
METISIRHTNDMHSHFGPWPKIKRFLLKKGPANGTVFRFDIGDAIDRLHPLTDTTLGKGNVAIMNEAKYTAATIGNNEGLVMSHEALNALYHEADFDVLLANVKDLKTKAQPDWAKPYQVYETAAGTKLAVLGMTAPYEQTYQALGWLPEDPEAILDEFLPKMRQEADLVVLLSHLGLPTDRKLAKKYPVDLILGAHTHHVLPEGEQDNGTWLAAAGRYGDYVGEVLLDLDESHQIQAVSVKAYQTAALPAKEADTVVVAAIDQAGQEAEEKQMATTYEPAVSTDEQAKDCLKALQSFYDEPVAVCSTGLFLKDLPAGPKSKMDFLNDLPHTIQPMLITLTGQELMDWMQEYEKAADRLVNQKIKGSGFRGQVFGKMISSGLGKNEFDQYTYQNEPIQTAKNYRIATLDHYRWLDFFKMLDDAPAQINLDVFLRELMADYYQKLKERTDNLIV